MSDGAVFIPRAGEHRASEYQGNSCEQVNLSTWERVFGNDRDNDYAVPFQIPGSTDTIFLRHDQIDAMLHTADRMGGDSSVAEGKGGVQIVVNGHWHRLTTQQFTQALQQQAQGTLVNG